MGAHRISHYEQVALKRAQDLEAKVEMLKLQIADERAAYARRMETAETFRQALREFLKQGE